MGDAILLESASQVIIFIQKDCADKIFIAKGYLCAYSSGDGESRTDLQCKIVGIKGDYMFYEKSMSNVFL